MAPPGPAAGIGLQGGIVELAGIGQGAWVGQGLRAVPSGRRLGLLGDPKQVALQGDVSYERKLLGGFRSHGFWGQGARS